MRAGSIVLQTESNYNDSSYVCKGGRKRILQYRSQGDAEFDRYIKREYVVFDFVKNGAGLKRHRIFYERAGALESRKRFVYSPVSTYESYTRERKGNWAKNSIPPPMSTGWWMRNWNGGKAVEAKQVKAALEKAGSYIDGLTIKSAVNVPEQVLAAQDRFFTWDNEKRSPLSNKGFLYDYSYYNGVVMEGLYDIYESDPDGGKAYYDYVKAYLDGLMKQEEDGSFTLDFERAGYVDCHGADCYKTAALFERFSKGDDAYGQVASQLYRHLTDESYVNSEGHTPCKDNMPAELGHNYWHSWRKEPRYKIWLDGIYMLQPFLAHHAARIGDGRQLELIQERLDWVAETLLAPNGMYYHAGNGKEDVCNFFWTRAIGWYGMAMVDVMEVLPDKYLEKRKAALKLFVDGMLKYQHESGIWANLADMPVTETNRLETSGTAMMSYTILKGVRKGWLDRSYQEAGLKAFVGLVEKKLDEGGLKDIYLKASANGSNNYEETEYYFTDEGKGSGPFIMACSEMLRCGGVWKQIFL